MRVLRNFFYFTMFISLFAICGQMESDKWDNNIIIGLSIFTLICFVGAQYTNELIKTK